MDEILADIEQARKLLSTARRVFLADGDALVLSTRRLLTIMEALQNTFPHLERVGTYANAQNILSKSDQELRQLVDRGLGIIYLGLESGSDEVLSRIDKGVSSAEMVLAMQKARQVGLMTSVIGILGLGGTELSDNHAQKTGQIVSQMDPNYFSMLTLMLVPGTKLHRQWQAGEFTLLSPQAMLSELRLVIGNLDGLSQCAFRTNHASNYLPLRGTLPDDKLYLLNTLDAALQQGTDALRPEAWRGL